MLTIRHARTEDAAALSAFGRRTFFETFAAQNSADDMKRYLSSAFSETRQAAELADVNTITLMAEDGSTLVAYAQLRLVAPPACVRGHGPVELVRFYVDQAWHGRGIAQTLMREVEAAAGVRGQTLWLGVWERNVRAIAFYTKCGFVDVGSHVFHLGRDAQTDRIMAKSLAPPAPV